jgi:hypothetical protein
MNEVGIRLAVPGFGAEQRRRLMYAHKQALVPLMVDEILMGAARRRRL